MIKRIYIDNYKCFVNFELQLDELTLLVGRNGVGKTAVLDVIYAVRRLLDGTSSVTDAEVFPTSTLTRPKPRDTQDTQVFEVEVALGGETLVYRLEVEHDRDERRARIMLESLEGDGGPLFVFERGDVQLYRDDHSKGPPFGSDWRRSALASVVPRPDNVRLTRFLELMRKTVICGPNPPIFAREAASEDDMLARDGANFVAWYRHLAQERQHLIPKHKQEVQAVIDGLQDFRLGRVGIDTRILLGIFGAGSDAPELRFDELSDGQRALTLLYALTSLTAHQGHVLMIDEPVNYVALREIQPWLITLADACGDDFPQAVLCSHHPEVIDYLGPDCGVLLTRDGMRPARAEPLPKGLEHLTKDGPLKLSEVLARGWER